MCKSNGAVTNTPKALSRWLSAAIISSYISSGVERTSSPLSQEASDEEEREALGLVL